MKGLDVSSYITKDEQGKSLFHYYGDISFSQRESLLYLLESKNKNEMGSIMCNLASQTILRYCYAYNKEIDESDRLAKSFMEVNTRLTKLYEDKGIKSNGGNIGISLCALIIKGDILHYLRLGDIYIGIMRDKNFINNDNVNTDKDSSNKKLNYELSSIEIKPNDIIFIASESISKIFSAQNDKIMSLISDDSLLNGSFKDISSKIVKINESSHQGGVIAIKVTESIQLNNSEYNIIEQLTKKCESVPYKRSIVHSLSFPSISKPKKSKMEGLFVPEKNNSPDVIIKPEKENKPSNNVNKSLLLEKVLPALLIVLLIGLLSVVGANVYSKYRKITSKPISGLDLKKSGNKPLANTDIPKDKPKSEQNTDISQPGKLIWQYNPGAEITSTPAVDENAVYFGCKDSRFYALDKNTGKILWRFATGGGIGSSPVVTNDRVIFGSYDRMVYALNKQTGKMIWRYRTYRTIVSSPAVFKGTVYIGSHDHRLHSIDLITGLMKWEFKTQNIVWSSPKTDMNAVYFGSLDGTFYALDLGTGKELWKFSTNSSIYSSPACSSQSVYFGTKDGSIYALKVDSGQLLWKYVVPGAIYSSPAVAGFSVYIGCDDGSVYSLDSQTGMLKWKYTSEGPIKSTPTIDDKFVYVGSYDGYIYALSTIDGNMKWRYKIGSDIYSSPTVKDGVVYVGSKLGGIVAVSTK